MRRGHSHVWAVPVRREQPGYLNPRVSCPRSERCLIRPTWGLGPEPQREVPLDALQWIPDAHKGVSPNLRAGTSEQAPARVRTHRRAGAVGNPCTGPPTAGAVERPRRTARVMARVVRGHPPMAQETHTGLTFMQVEPRICGRLSGCLPTVQPRGRISQRSTARAVAARVTRPPTRRAVPRAWNRPPSMVRGVAPTGSLATHAPPARQPV